ncbi:hypothetical protein AYI70_g7140 [Smittium culicis]|uniref:Uncharacterized protein n=1 Tax=Smittium culicis TaxID=133412 RepID=A0A1R1XLV4_9FUNG|nr:hypothetical protein AYI70_g7140 [Smittium culicis]
MKSEFLDFTEEIETAPEAINSTSATTAAETATVSVSTVSASAVSVTADYFSASSDSSVSDNGSSGSASLGSDSSASASSVAASSVSDSSPASDPSHSVPSASKKRKRALELITSGFTVPGPSYCATKKKPVKRPLSSRLSVITYPVKTYKKPVVPKTVPLAASGSSGGPTSGPIANVLRQLPALRLLRLSMRRK